MPERSIQIFGVDLVRLGPERHAAAKAFAEHFERDHQIRLHHLTATRDGRARTDTRRRRPRQEFRVRGDIGHQIVHFLCGIWQGPGFVVRWHKIPKV